MARFDAMKLLWGFLLAMGAGMLFGGNLWSFGGVIPDIARLILGTLLTTIGVAMLEH